MATFIHDGSDTMPTLTLGDTLVVENSGTTGVLIPRGWLYRGDKSFAGFGSVTVESVGFDNFDDITLRRMGDSDAAEPVGKYVFAEYPLDTAKSLAVAVIKGEPCGRELVDCLIESGVVDPESEALRHARLETLDAVKQVLLKCVDDEAAVRMGTSYQGWIESMNRSAAFERAINLICDLT